MKRKIQTVLISVSDKGGLIPFAKGLNELGINILSTGGTAGALRDAGIRVRDVSALTEFPECLGGRVKTLHPKVHGAILHIRDNPEHQREVAMLQIENIDAVVVNLYPFVQTIDKLGVTVEDAIENIDIGGPAMLRSAAKNSKYVAVITEPADYPEILTELERNDGCLSQATRLGLLQKAFRLTASYDLAIAEFVQNRLVVNESDEIALSTSEPELLPKRVMIIADRDQQDLSYGENPHQKAALYLPHNVTGGIARATRLLSIKDVSFNNFVDADAAWNAVSLFGQPACAIVKHTVPCGLAVGEDICEAFLKAYASDPKSAYGGVVAVNRPIDAETAREIAGHFFELVAAPKFDVDANEILGKKSKLRRLQVGAETSSNLEVRSITGGLLVQERDIWPFHPEGKPCTTATLREPTPAESEALNFAWRVAMTVKSNAVVFTSSEQILGVGSGQPNRVGSVLIAAQQMAEALRQGNVVPDVTVVASDGFLPFDDGLIAAAEAGATALIQPGGSIRDDDVIAAANEHNMAMVFTGMRHFKH